MKNNLFNIRHPIYNYMVSSLIYTSSVAALSSVLFILSFYYDLKVEPYKLSLFFVIALIYFCVNLLVYKQTLVKFSKFQSFFSLVNYIGILIYIVWFFISIESYPQMFIFLILLNTHVLISLFIISGFFNSSHQMIDLKSLGYDYSQTPTIFKLSYFDKLVILTDYGQLSVGYGRFNFNKKDYDLMDIRDYFKEHNLKIENLCADDLLVMEMFRY